MDFFKRKIKGYRTLIINVLLSIMPILEMTEVLDVLPEEWASPYVIALAIINMYMRYITTTPVGKQS